MASLDPPMLDVLIVGAGIAGINAAYRVQTEAPPGTTYAIFEARDSLGGTWDLFRYPGIRSDSDMFTYGFSWRPWPKDSTLAAGQDIKEYIEESANAPLEARIPGIERFRGKTIHPQFWPEDYDCTGKEVVVIGSGATAVTIVPSIAGEVKHVSMLQRSPTYILPVAKYGVLAPLLSTFLPSFLAWQLNRLIAIVLNYIVFVACRTFPKMAKRAICRRNMQLLPPEVAWDPHFKPRYNPWEQRLCAAQDGDFFAALCSGKASIVTDTIETITESEIKLASGHTLQPDAIVTATGLKLKFAGGIDFSKDEKPYDLTQKFAWKASMLQDLPDVFFSVGYENASWTLGVDCAAQLLTRVMAEIRNNNAKFAMPYIANPGEMKPRRMMSLSSTYIEANGSKMPKAGTGNWGPRTNYISDLYAAKWGDVKTGLLLA